MNEKHTCDIIDLEKSKTYNQLLYNDTLMMSSLRDYTVNFTGDWSVKMAEVRALLRYNQMIYSPGSEILYCRVYNALWFILPPIILALGTIGNLLSFSVLCRRSMIQVSSYIYLAVLALVDEGVLITGLLRKWIDRMMGHRLDDTHRIACKTVNVFGLFSSYLSVWLIVALTVERALVITFPFRANRLATPRRAQIIIVSTAIACLLTSSHFFETVDLIGLYNLKGGINNPNISDRAVSGGSKRCDFQPRYAAFGSIWTWLDAALYSYLPFGVITVLNIIIIYGVYKARQNRQEMTHGGRSVIRTRLQQLTTRSSSSTGVSSWQTTQSCSSQSSSSSTENMRQLTVLLLAISFFFLIFTTPIVVVKFAISLSRTKQIEQQIEKGDQLAFIQTNAKLQLVDCVAEMLMYCNHALNFFLYCAMGNKFRHQLISLFCKSRNTATIKRYGPPVSTSPHGNCAPSMRYTSSPAVNHHAYHRPRQADLRTEKNDYASNNRECLLDHIQPSYKQNRSNSPMYLVPKELVELSGVVQPNNNENNCALKQSIHPLSCDNAPSNVHNNIHNNINSKIGTVTKSSQV